MEKKTHNLLKITNISFSETLSIHKASEKKRNIWDIR